MPTSPCASRRGQSFVGLLMVLLVLALLTAFAAPRMDVTRYRSDAIGRQAGAVFTAAARTSRQERSDVLVHVDSAGKRIATLIDRNGNGQLDAGESEIWVALDPGADILDPPQRLPAVPDRPVLRRRGVVSAAALSSRDVVFQRRGAAGHDYVLYLTSDPTLPSAWRAVTVSAQSGAVQLWRFDGNRWSRGRS